jgi:molybdate transport system substrate-binding protein
MVKQAWCTTCCAEQTGALSDLQKNLVKNKVYQLMKIKNIIYLFFFMMFICSCSTVTSKQKVSDPTQTSSKTGDSLLVLSAVGMRQVLLDLIPKFEQATGMHVSISFNSSGEIVKLINDGKFVDVVIVGRPDIDRLTITNKIISGSQADLASSRVGVAVLKGAPKPDISSQEAFKKAMLQAKTIACPDPRLGGSSGKHINKIFEELGIAEEVRSKLVLVSTPDDEKSMPGYLVANGKAEIALHQMQELMAVPGIDIVGPLPGNLQATFIFTATIINTSKQVNSAKSLIRFIRSANAKNIIKSKGMYPAAQ